MARATTKKPAVTGRRYPRFKLDVDWFVESRGCSTLGRGLELSVRSALLPVTCASPFLSDVTLYVSLPARARMFKARCTAKLHAGRGWVLQFEEVAPEDLQLLGHTLVTEFGVAALPNLENRLEQTLSLT
ncbi:MAG: hypothetical protein DI536_06860 [Archangium gephyra]|uniref:PilZ domain-containing protein n=1 Tax=Archangium gephyra TaxID=48 RepID=A0A2W5VJ74_9BACT|nr:MAG: hypothetical protein DI536_06860 [Archangium gephyra]